ncbi:unnamed protein product [Adineta steineri]|uniref:Uncharacterized protein n=2 Tax=Adineta steineri TaxID=433720 RepID=A0A815BVF3_9BILA|nr:unnamed protein product [Adineta steineri]
MAAVGNVDPLKYTRVSDIVKEPVEMLMPIEGYEQMPIVSLREPVAPLLSILPKIQDYADIVKKRCKPVPPDGLTRDESASIMLYSMEWEPHEECLSFALNAALRTEDRKELKPWFSYLKLILTALEKLPSTPCNVFRGVNLVPLHFGLFFLSATIRPFFVRPKWFLSDFMLSLYNSS